MAQDHFYNAAATGPEGDLETGLSSSIPAYLSELDSDGEFRASFDASIPSPASPASPYSEKPPRSGRSRGPPRRPPASSRSAAGGAGTGGPAGWAAAWRRRWPALSRSPLVIMLLLGSILALIILVAVKPPSAATASLAHLSNAARLAAVAEARTQIAAEALAEATDKPPLNFEAAISWGYQPSLGDATFPWAGFDRPDGSYYASQGGLIHVAHMDAAVPHVTLADPSKLKLPSGDALSYMKFTVSPDERRIVFSTDFESGWRHSFFVNYFVLDRETNALTALPQSKPDKVIDGELGAGKTSLLQFGPTGNTVAWVRDNDLYVTVDAAHGGAEIRVTRDGSKNMINGIADWVYEEEILASHTALWFSPDARHIAYLKFNETDVPVYRLQKFMQSDNNYPVDLTVKYPKSGAPNPVVALWVATPGTGGAQADRAKTDGTKADGDQADGDQTDGDEAENGTTDGTSSRMSKRPHERRETFDAGIDPEANVVVEFPPFDESPSANATMRERLFTELTWIDTDRFLVRTMNRVQDHQQLFLVTRTETAAAGDAPSVAWKPQLVRNETTPDGAWFSMLQPLTLLRDPATLMPNATATTAERPAPRKRAGYLELKETDAGFTHIAYYADVGDATPAAWLTGQTQEDAHSEVTEIIGVDERAGWVYYRSTLVVPLGNNAHRYVDSTQRHIYRTALPQEAAGPDAPNRPPHVVHPLTPPHPQQVPPAPAPANQVFQPMDPKLEAHPTGPETGLYNAVFSPRCTFYLLKYEGPDMPRSDMLRTDTIDWSAVVNDNQRSRQAIAAYSLPSITFLRIPNAVGGFMNARLIVPADYKRRLNRQRREQAALLRDAQERADAARAEVASASPATAAVAAVDAAAAAAAASPDGPPLTADWNGGALQANTTFRPRTGLPVLMKVYGGPGSQLVTRQYTVDYMTAMSSAEGYVVLIVDGRGTGFEGRAFRSTVSRHLGDDEVSDQIAAAKWLATQFPDLVDPTRIAIWGWSFGGFMTAKVLERDDAIISAGVSVAPVADWEYYDSMYTERFMKTPEQNPTGYERSRVSRLGGFHRQPYLLVHGMADDNVHMQNSADLVWQLTRERVHNYDLQLYPDNDHSIQNGAARLEIYRLMRRWLNAHVRDRVLSIAVDEQAARVEREEAIERAKEALREQAQKAALLAANDAPGAADPAIDGMSAPKPTASSSDASASSTPVMNVEDRAWRRLLADLETYRHATPIEPYYVLAQ